MHNKSYVFAQLTSFLNRNKFIRIVAKYHGDSYIKHFSCWNQLKVLMFGQLSRRDSLRDLIVAVEAHRGKAKFRKKKGGIKVHTLYDVEARVPAFFHITTASVHDSIIELVTYKSRNDYPKQLRRVEYYDEELKKNFVFLTMVETASEDQEVLG